MTVVAFAANEANAEKYARLKEREFITEDGEVNIMLIKGDYNEFFAKIPELEESYEFYCKYDSDIDVAIHLPIYALEICHPDKKEEIEAFARCYFSMIVFDIFIGQTDRNMNNYGVIYTEDSYLFAPLFDNSTLAKPYLPENLYSLNKVIIDREKILRVLVDNYSIYVVDLIRKITKIYAEKKELIFEMIDMWIDNHNKALIKKNIESAYLLFKEI